MIDFLILGQCHNAGRRIDREPENLDSVGRADNIATVECQRHSRAVADQARGSVLDHQRIGPGNGAGAIGTIGLTGDGKCAAEIGSSRIGIEGRANGIGVLRGQQDRIAIDGARVY